MDDQWLMSLDRSTCVLVPTRSLQNDLYAQVARAHLRAGDSVWASPNIATWNDYLQHLWLANRSQIDIASALIDNAQSRILWERVIEKTRREDDQLLLLNVAQTARAAQRSWQLVHDWQLDIEGLRASSIEDTRQFGKWCFAYLESLSNQKLLDVYGLYQQLVKLVGQNQLKTFFKNIIWYGFDFTTSAQRQWREASTQQEIRHTDLQPAANTSVITYACYPNSRDELRHVLQQARALLEGAPEQRINIVVPDLQQQRGQVESLAAEVFYPGWSPLQILNTDLAVRFSLGQPSADWIAIATALRVLKTLSGRIQSVDLNWLWRNQFLSRARSLRTETVALERWLQNARISQLSLAALPDLLSSAGFAEKSELLAFTRSLCAFQTRLQEELDEQAEQGRFKTLSLRRWRELFSDWLELWGWSTAADANSLDSVQFQLLQRWQELLTQFEGLQTVQSRSGQRRALDLLHQLARDQVFLPKAPSSPVFICGIFDALGMPSDVTFVTGMHEHYPTPARIDPFLSSALRNSPDYPSATATRHLQQARAVMQSLLNGAPTCQVSYSLEDQQDASIKRSVSSLFRHEQFIPCTSSPPAAPTIKLETFLDTQGPAVGDPDQLRGGTSIFTDQSNCAFKAFARHRLECGAIEESEFGLDPIDRGNIVHFLLERCWQQIRSKAELDALIRDNKIEFFLHGLVSAGMQAFASRLAEQKQQLLKLEKTRLISLLREWLELEAARPTPFFISAVEEQGEHQLGGIRFRYKIDRIDFNEQNDTLVIDYKTGNTQRADLHGERLKQPQLPLYVQAITAQKNNPPAGIALAQVKKHDCRFTELSEVGILSPVTAHTKKYAEQWAAAKARWPAQLEQLAAEFLAGDANVNPIDSNTCKYCDLHALCRIRQLTNGAEESGESYDE